ncbi:peptidylprolyl isomerase [Marinobacter halodurans]|uniref:Peptidyl-prolyl cis-trans isomerase n=1 Tax=Marinobacter halodurans TaxID=2528979 RepID=A0ABY1ZQF6_9GAMM|nr:peptidylprolyl isomerase [Marinobacter halodurans]
MDVIFLRVLPAVLLTLGLATGAQAAKTDNDALPKVRLDTTEGVITIRLRPDIAPRTVANFLEYVRAGYYDGTIFHRVIPGFMVQGGGFTSDMNRKTTRSPVPNEASATFGNVRGSVAMARTSDPDSATSQFFINLVDNHFLDKGVRGAGYTVFGTVTDGMGAVDAIGNVPTGQQSGRADVPTTPIVIRSATVVEPDQDAKP